MTESVNGIVIGPITHRCELRTPNGNLFGQLAWFESESEAKQWAESVRKQAIAENPIFAEHQGWNREWELRFYE